MAGYYEIKDWIEIYREWEAGKVGVPIKWSSTVFIIWVILRLFNLLKGS